MSTTHFKCCVLRNFCFAVSKCRYCLSRLKIWSEGNRNVHYSIKWFREFYRDIEYTKSYSIVATIQCLYETVAIRMIKNTVEKPFRNIFQWITIDICLYIFFFGLIFVYLRFFCVCYCSCVLIASDCVFLFFFFAKTYICLCNDSLELKQHD